MSHFHFHIHFSDQTKVRPCQVLTNKWPESLNFRTDIEDTAPRINSDFKPTDDALIQGQKRKQWRRERRVKRIIAVAVGWSVIVLMMYLIAVMKTTVAKIWDPYDILEITRVRSFCSLSSTTLTAL